MTEAEWRECDNPERLLATLVTATHRRRQLFACGCCRRIGELLTTEGLHAIEVAERFADGDASLRELIAVRPNLPARTSAVFGHTFDSQAAVGCAVDLPECSERWGHAHRWAAAASTDAPAEWRTQSDLFRDIFGNPFRPVTLDPSWLTSDVVALARGIYEERAFDRMPILADALQDARCDSDDVLNHCRGDGPHVRGCWVVDLLLGKE